VWQARLLLALLAVALGSIVGSGLAVLFMDPVHDGIARLQHVRRQRLLKRRLLEQEWAGVPDGALSRAPTPARPEPTQASLSLAEAPEEEPPRLAAAVGAAEEEEAQEQRVEVSRRTAWPGSLCAWLVALGGSLLLLGAAALGEDLAGGVREQEPQEGATMSDSENPRVSARSEAFRIGR
jgi:hypothetical protein